MKYLMPLILLLLLGCTTQMPNDQIISETKKCHDVGMKAQVRWNGITNQVIGVQCVPAEEK